MTKPKTKPILKTLSTLVTRALLATKLGKQYGTDRDLYEALGYPTEITFDDYLMHYTRQDMAAAVINKPVNYTWRGDVMVSDNADDDSSFKKAWKELLKNLSLKSKFIRLDKLTCLGKYGVLLLGFDDVKEIQEFKNPVQAGKRTLLYLKPYGQGDISIVKWEQEPTEPRYGLPFIYQIKTSANESDNDALIQVHYSRVIHVPGELLTSEVEGIPVLQKVYNRLMDLEKLVGGSAEMFWRGARPGYQTQIKDDYQMGAVEESNLKAQFDEYEHHLRRFLTIEGVDIKELATQVSNPESHVDIQIQMISAASGIPKRILIGSERGELASTQDKVAWLEEVQNRREEYAELQIIKVFVDICIKYKILPMPEGGAYTIEWEDLFAPSEKDKAEVGKTRATALKEYLTNPAVESIVSPEAFFKYFLGLKEEQITDIIELRDAEMNEEIKSIKEAEEEEAE